MATLFSEHFQTFNSNGTPNAGALLYFYAAGTTTPIVVYQDGGATTPHASPVVADAAGLFAPIYLTGSAAFKTVLKTAAGVTILTADNIGVPVVHGATGTITVPGLIDASGAGAGQIKFPATQNDSGDANTLDDYEEGTWQPTLSFGGSTSGIVYATRTGRYTKIGRMVFGSGAITLTDNGSGSGNAIVDGLPFTVATPGGFTVVAITGFSSLTAGLVGRLSSGSTQFTFRMPSTTGAAIASDTNITNTAQMEFTFSYSV